MLGAFVAWMLLHYLGLATGGRSSWRRSSWALSGIVIERLLISRLYHLDHLYGLLLTFGLALIIQGLFCATNSASRASPTHARRSFAAAEPRLHVPAQLPRLGVVASLVVCLRHLVHDRAHAARRLSARRHREPDAGAAPSASTCR
jgi:branched-subunit amino acid ABC-type transport system permease component